MKIYIMTILVLLSFTGCNSLGTAYTVGKVTVPLVVEDEEKLDKLRKVNEVVEVISGAIDSPK